MYCVCSFALFVPDRDLRMKTGIKIILRIYCLCVITTKSNIYVSVCKKLNAKIQFLTWYIIMKNSEIFLDGKHCNSKWLRNWKMIVKRANETLFFGQVWSYLWCWKMFEILCGNCCWTCSKIKCWRCMITCKDTR